MDDLDFEALETAARRRALKVAAQVIEKTLNADLRDHAEAKRPRHTSAVLSSVSPNWPGEVAEALAEP